MTSRLDEDRRAIAEILTHLAEGGIAGRSISLTDINSRMPEARLDINRYIGLMVWLQDEDIIRSGGKPTMDGSYYRVQLSSIGLRILELESPLATNETLEKALAHESSPEARTKLGEFIGSVLGSGLSAFIKSGSGA